MSTSTRLATHRVVRLSCVFAFLFSVTVGAVTAPAAAMSGGCKETPHELHQLQAAVTAGERLFDYLEESGAKVAIVARVGTDQSKRGLRYTHAGLAWRDHPRGRWHFVHQLNHCASNRSDIFDDGPVNFFLERPFSYDALVAIPSPRLQDRLGELLSTDAPRRLHTPSYSAIANPFATRFQNSNQWVLELIAVALAEGPVTRAAAQDLLEEKGFEPERTRLGFFERIGARRMKNVSLDDHSRRELRSGGYQWVSARSVVKFLEQVGQLESRTELLHP